MNESDGRGPRPSREGSLVWLLVVAGTAAVLLSLALPLAQGLKASAEIIGRHPTNGEMVPGGPAAQMDQAISNLDAILHDCGSALERVIHTQVMAMLDTDLDVLAQVFERRFASRLPAASWVGVSFLAEEPGIDAISVNSASMPRPRRSFTTGDRAKNTRSGLVTSRPSNWLRAEEPAFQIAWAAVKRRYRKSGESWVEK